MIRLFAASAPTLRTRIIDSAPTRFLISILCLFVSGGLALGLGLGAHL
jgi:hypothetical protein